MQAIRLAAAAAKVHHYAEPALTLAGVHQPVSVRAVEVALQTVKQHHARLMARQLRIFAPGEIDEVAVRQVEALPVRTQQQTTAHQTRQHRLQMRIAQGARWHKARRCVRSKIHVASTCRIHITLLASLGLLRIWG